MPAQANIFRLLRLNCAYFYRVRRILHRSGAVMHMPLFESWYLIYIPDPVSIYWKAEYTCSHSR